MTVLLPLTIDYRHSNIWSPVVQNGPPQWQKLSPPCLNQAKQNYNKEKPWNKVLGVCRDRGEKHGLHCTQLCQLALYLNEQLEVMFFCLFLALWGFWRYMLWIFTARLLQVFIPFSGECRWKCLFEQSLLPSPHQQNYTHNATGCCAEPPLLYTLAYSCICPKC